MFGKKKEVKRRPRPPGGLAQYGLYEVPDHLEGVDGEFGVHDDANDEDLEAELAALTNGSDAGRQPRRKAPGIPVANANLDAMVAASMKDIGSDEELSGDDDDPDLLEELNEITGVESASPEPTHEENPRPPSRQDDANNKLLEERLVMYRMAEKKAKAGNEGGRARRYNRGIKTLETMLAEVHSGKNIDPADIPPALPASATNPATDTSSNATITNDTDSTHAIEPTSPSSPLSPPSSEESAPPPAVDEETLAPLRERQREYRVAALMWKKEGNTEEAIRLVKIAKQFDLVIAALIAGNVVDLSDMPSSPSLPSSVSPSGNSATTEKQESERQQAAPEEPAPSAQVEGNATDVGMALRERLEVYRRSKTAAEEEQNAGKARRYGRICKQFEDAIKLHARGKPVPFEELPVPPGFPPIVTPTDTSAPPDPAPAAIPEPIPSKEEASEDSPGKKPPVPPPRVNIGQRKQRQMSRAEKQQADILQRQHELKQAALSAKKDGDMELARDYLRQAKGMQPLIEASKAGLPVDMDTLPLSPLAKIQLSLHQLDTKDQEVFTVVSSEDCAEDPDDTDQQIYDNMEAQLVKQIKWCLSTRDHSKALGDVAGYNRWERLALGYTHDLDMLRVRRRDALPPPQHHYQTKSYAIVQSCTDLGDTDLEVTIIRGVNYPREADTYVTFEFPYPADNSPSDKTPSVKESSNPEYQSVFPLSGIVDRSRQCQRAFKRHALKCQVWAKGGFFRSDSLIGTVTVKLQQLETQCILHDSFPLMDGRKAVGGKLEIKMRLRNPILTKQIEQVTDKWLTIDQ